MTKRKVKSARSPLAMPIVVAEATEIAVSAGVLVIRTGTLNKPPTVLTVPAELIPQFLSHQQEATRAAEEEYWDLVPAFRAGARSEDNLELGRAKGKWLRAQPWHRALAKVPEAENHPLFRIEYAGHVGLVAAAPFTAVRTLVIFDPLQLRRLANRFAEGADAAQRSLPAADPNLPARLQQAQRHWSLHPWPGTPIALPTQKQAEDIITGLHMEFLRRTPINKHQ
ncbi:hypothetical protein ACWCYZ_33575 [Streptomyces virginiae]